MDKNRGSQFRKWDLHVHSLYSHSHLSNQYKMNENNQEECFDKFLEKLKENDINAIGLTNYFNFSEQDFSLKRKLEDKGIVVFLNLELRLENGNAKDEVWTQAVKFKNEEDKFRIAVAKFNQSASRAKDVQAVKADYVALRQSCISCHEAFKEGKTDW